MTSRSITTISNRVDEIGKSMDNFQQRLDTILSSHKQESNVTPQSKLLQELRTDFMLFQKETNESLSSVKKDIGELKSQVSDTSRQVDELNQYSRRNCILIHGINQSPNENVDSIVLQVIHEKLNLKDIGLSHLDRCHRIGSPRRAADIVRHRK